jgi:hypothetical protein
MMTLTARVLHYAAKGWGLREAITQAQKDADEDARTIARTKRLLACYKYTPVVQSRLRHQRDE